MVMVPYNFKDFINNISLQVKSGLIPITRINDAFRRILRVKFTIGFLEHPLANPVLANQLTIRSKRSWKEKLLGNIWSC